MTKSAVVTLALAASACTGIIADPSVTDEGEPAAPHARAEPITELPVTGMRRLTQREMGNTLDDLFGEESGIHESYLPADRRTPGGVFDNEWALQESSEALIAGAEQLAWSIARRVVGDPARRDAIVPCTPAGPSDAACFERFVVELGRLVLRRPLEEADVTAFLALLPLAEATDDFDDAVVAAIAAFLQHPRFLYRIEIGTPLAGDPTTFRLDPYEVASRLSYLIWASTPDSWLLDLARDGRLDTSDSLREVAEEMLTDARAIDAARRYHAQWLDYEEIPVAPELEASMRVETDALVSRVLFEDRAPWRELFLREETFVGDDLARHYGLELPGSSEPVWVDYGGTGRRGILSHGAFLAPPQDEAETNPTVRGLAVRARLLCQELEPPANVMTDAAAAAEGDCKPDVLAAHASGGCAGCHRLIDPIGFGLEAYDNTGRFRTHETDKPHCTVDGVGEIVAPDLGTFVGPGGLGELLADAPEVRECMVRQLVRYALGSFDLSAGEAAVAETIRAGLSAAFRFDEVVIAVVTHPFFVHRRDADE